MIPRMINLKHDIIKFVGKIRFSPFPPKKPVTPLEKTSSVE